jgi:hypothetical protein
MFIAAIDQQSLRTGPDPLDSSKMKTDTDAQLLQVAHEICDTVGAGGLPADANSGFKGLTAAEYLAVNEEIGKGTLNAKRVALAIQTICPQFVPILNQALTGKYAKAAPLTTFPDGTYRVGTDIAPGTYQTTTNSSGCYWDRTDANGGTIANNFVTGAPQVRVTISSSDTGFHSDHCGTWAKIG